MARRSIINHAGRATVVHQRRAPYGQHRNRTRLTAGNDHLWRVETHYRLGRGTLQIIAEEWRIYDKTTPPRWEFPKGLFLERYDNKFKVNLRFAADSAWLYNQNVWKLRGNVVLDDKTSQSRLRTQELYWNMQTGEMASNVHTILKQPQQEIEGTWFRATMQNGHPTQYHIRQSRGFMPMGDVAGPQQPQPNASDNGGQAQADSTQQPKRDAPVSHPKTRRE